jgi:hypothetical protein
MLLACILAVTVGTSAVAALEAQGPWKVCDGPPWRSSSSCTPSSLSDVDPQGRVLWLTSDVRLGGPGQEPAAVFVSAYAASEVYWDGKLIGRNGAPSDRPQWERPGLRDAAFQIAGPTPGVHKLALRMSSHHGIVRLRSPVTRVSVAPFERATSTVMRDYLPALVSAGGLLIMVAMFGFASWSGHRTAGSAYLLGAALFATAQLGAEASRAFLQYPYPVLFLRIGLVLAFAAGFGFMLPAYVARRFAPARLRIILLAQLVGTIAALLLVPSFDQKTGLVLTSSIGIAMLLSIHAAMRSAPGALPLAAMLALGLLLSLVEPYSFLNRDLYLWTASLFVLLLAAEARRMKIASSPAEAGAAPPLRGPQVPQGICLGTAAARRFLLPGDIVRVAAADDYSEVFLGDGGSLLHPEPLQKLLERLPAEFVRVHRSHAINLAHLRSFRKGSRSSVILSDQSVAPVSRRRVGSLVAALGG